MVRFCTIKLKLEPIFYYCYNLESLQNMVVMNIGFRHDERQRKTKMMTDCDKAYSYKIPFYYDLEKQKYRHKSIEYRIPNFPLIDNKITNQMIVNFWKQEKWEFPEISNCDFCFFHRINELQRMKDLYPERIKWWIEMEEKIGATFNKNFKMRDIDDPQTSILELPLFSYSEDFNCNCTD